MLAEGREEAIFVIAPVLLLLNQDPLLLPTLEEKRRYVAPYLAVFSYLLATAIKQASSGYESAFETPWPRARLVQGVLLALCSVPNHVMLLTYLWHRRKQSEWPLLFFSPLNVLPILFGGRPAVLLALLAGAGALVQTIVMRTLRRRGLQMI